MRPLAAAVLLVVLAGCGTSTEPASEPTSSSDELAVAQAEVDADAAPEQLRQVAERSRQQGSVRYAAVVEGSREGEPSQVDARMEGELDTRADAGTAELDLVALTDLAAMAEAEGAPQTEGTDLAAVARARLSWTPETVTFRTQGQEETVPRDGEDTALLARLPEEPGALLEVASTATDVTVRGTEDVDGTPTTHLEGTVDPRAAVETGLGTSGQLAIAELGALPIEVWLDADGLPRRLRYTVTLPSLVAGSAPRTSVTTYDYRGWGEPVDLTD